MSNPTLNNFTEETAIKMMQLLKELYEKQLKEERQFNNAKSIDRQVENKEEIHPKNQRNKALKKEINALIESIEDTETLKRILHVLKKSV